MRQLAYFILSLPLIFWLAACGSDDNQSIEVGADAPDFTLADARGGEVSLSDFSGQPVLLYFHMAVG